MKIVECPRDAMQGLKAFIPTEKKIKYLSQLLKVGFDTIDCGSFVSPKVIPQMRDTGEVLKQLDISKGKSKLLVIVANMRGAEDACKFDDVSYLGFPMSISETFQKRNTNRSITDALNELEQIINIAHAASKKVVSYISMGFGNPYGDPFDESIVTGFADLLVSIGSDVVSLADTIGISSEEQIRSLFTTVSQRFPGKEIGAHLHATPDAMKGKVEAAYDAGCRRIDGALKGYGGCPMAKDDLVGNIATETVVSVIESRNVHLGIDKNELNKALLMASEIFPNH